MELGLEEAEHSGEAVTTFIEKDKDLPSAKIEEMRVIESKKISSARGRYTHC